MRRIIYFILVHWLGQFSSCARARSAECMLYSRLSRALQSALRSQQNSEASRDSGGYGEFVYAGDRALIQFWHVLSVLQCG